MSIRKPTSIRAELRSLLDDMADSRLSPEQIERLNELLSTHPEARQSYIEMSTLCAGLEWIVGARPAAPAELLTTLGRELSDDELPEEAATVSSRLPVLGFLNTAVDFARRPLISFLLGALVFTGVLWAGRLLRLPADGSAAESMTMASRTSEPISQRQQLERPVSATLTGMVDCRWSDPAVAPTYGEQLYEGQAILFDSGLVQLTFESGAKLIIQGPAECTVDSDMLLALDVGKLTAVVPHQASGFTVLTPIAEIVDLGTEFGVQVGSSGEVEVHVFDGEVVSRPLDEHGELQDEIVRLVENEAFRFDRTMSVPTRRAVDHNRFVREITPRLSEDELPPLPVKSQLALWLAADVRVQTDDQNRVVAWNDLLAGDNQTEEDAWQQDPLRRPLWVANAIGGKPAIRFDGKTTGLLTTPIATTDEQTVTAVFSLSAGAIKRKMGGVLVQYNGPPHRILKNISDPGILEINDRTGSGVFQGLVFAGFRDGKNCQFGGTASRQLEVGEAAILTYVYDRANNLARLLLNGVVQDSTTAPGAAACISRKAIGYHPRPAHDFYFLGDIAEFFIFNAALENEQLDAVHQYLGEKYLIQTGVARQGVKSEY